MIQPLVSICSSLFYRVDCLLLRAVTAVKQEKKCSGASATSSFSQWTLQFLPDVTYTHKRHVVKKLKELAQSSGSI